MKLVKNIHISLKIPYIFLISFIFLQCPWLFACVYIAHTHPHTNTKEYRDSRTTIKMSDICHLI